MSKIATVTGDIESSALGRTLMHEHLVIGYPGWESHARLPKVTPADEVAIWRIERTSSVLATTDVRVPDN